MPHKTCTLDCIYCECGKTTRKTLTRREYVPTGDIRDELHRYLSGAPELDHVTFSGAGEPTLHSGIGDLITFLKKEHPEYRIALLTNGTLLGDPVVRETIAGADSVIASLDAATLGGFKKINRPHPGLTVSKMIRGLAEFKHGFSHRFFIEIFIVPGVNDSAAELAALKTALGKIHPDEVHLNTLDRPGTEPWVEPAEASVLQKISDALGGAGVAHFEPEKRRKKGVTRISDFQLMETLRRRPCTVEDISTVFHVPDAEAQKRLEGLVAEGRAEKRRLQRGTFYLSRPEKRPVRETG